MTKRTNREILAKGVKIMAGSLFCMFLGPTVIHSAFQNQDKPLYIPVLIIGVLIAGFAVFLGFKGIKTILDAMFQK